MRGREGWIKKRKKIVEYRHNITLRWGMGN
jgi:hypothetical protein